jgi:Eukaryotic aspartyl protease
MLVDTSSSYFYVPYANCTLGGCAGRATLGLQDSTSLNVTKQKFSLDLFYGDVSGVVVEDTLNLAGFSIPRMSIGGVQVYDAGVNQVLICPCSLTIGCMGWQFGTWVIIRRECEWTSFCYGSIGASLLVF